MVPMEDALREAFLPIRFGGEEVNADLREILGRSVKHGGLDLLDPWLSAERAYTFKSVSEVMVGSLLGVIDLNYVTHKSSVCRMSADGQKRWEYLDINALT